MSKIDEFESLFKSAAKPIFHIEPIRIKKSVIVVDVELDVVAEFVQRIGDFLKVLNSVESTIEIAVVSGSEFQSVGQLLDTIKGQSADLICTYRNLHGSANDFPFSLGECVDVLTQATDIPVLLVPRPNELTDSMLINTDRVMLMTDHLAGDNRLVSYGALFTQDHGKLILAHVEDEQTFLRYMQVISKIQDIDTDVAKEAIMEQLLKEPRDFIDSCEDGLKQAGLPLEIVPVVTVGHHLADYRNLVSEHEADLLILNTKDEDQLAMHGLAYPVSVELRDLPLLLI